MPKLVIIKGPAQGREYDISDSAILGRSPSCEVYINELTASRQHARLKKTDQGWSIEDMGSGNGTFINEELITSRQLKNNDEIRISKCVLRFLDDEPQKPKEGGRWVNMVTVMAQPGLINTFTQAHITVPPVQDLPEEDLRADLRRTHHMLETLYAVTAATSSTLDPKELHQKILDYLFNIFPDASQGYILLMDAEGQLIPSAIRERQTGESRGLVISQTVVNQVVHEGNAVLSTPDAEETWTGISKMCAPLSAQGKVLGILHIEGSEHGQPFSQEDLDLLAGIAQQAGVSILNAQMHQQLMGQQRLEQDMHFARQVQHSFLPSETLEVPGFLFDHTYIPAFDVGGDFYDFIPLPDRRIGVLIGDVSGKGVSAALLMARITSDMRYYAISERAPGQVLAKANASLLKTAQDNMFATVLYLVLDLVENSITLSNAGHIPPFLRRAKNNEIVEISEASSLALGVLPDADFDEYSLFLEPRATILLSTDGGVEAQNAAREE